MKNILFFILVLVSASTALAKFDLPRNLTREDRRSLLEILGYGTKSKILSSPVPLGGFDGFEVGYSNEFIPISDLKGLGSGTQESGEMSFGVLTLGKGLVYNLDTFFHVTPLPQESGVFSYGAHLRWGFWEFRRFPGVLTLISHASGTNFDNRIATRTSGADLVMTVALDQVSLYFGGGPIRTIGTFNGGVLGVTYEGDTKDEDLSGFHTVFGLSLGFQSFALTFEIDRVVQSSYAARVSYRF